jgi:hypothetical protein
MRVIRVPIPTEITVTDPNNATVALHLVMGTCKATFTGLDAAKLATRYNDWVSQPDPGA